jgi:hypothetical protein
MGIPAYEWEIHGNDTGIGIFNSNTSQNPMTIAPGALNDSLFIAATGVGLGTPNPAAALHVRKTAQASTAEVMARFNITDDALAYLQISNGSTTNGQFIPRMLSRSTGTSAAMLIDAIITTDSGSGPAIAYNANKAAGGALSTRPLVAYRNNGVAKVTIAADGTITSTGAIVSPAINTPSSRALKHDIVELESKKAGDALRQLTPVEFVYNDDEAARKRIGFIAEDVPDLVANAGRNSVPVMDIVATLTRVVKDQQQTIDEQKKLNAELLKRLAALESKMQD